MGKGMSGNQRLGQAPAPFFQTPSAFSPHRPQDNLWWGLLCPLYRFGHQDLAFIETTWDISISRLSDFKSHFLPRPESLYHSCLWSLQLLLSKISPHFLQTDSARGEITDSYTHGCFPPTWYPGWPTPHPWARWQLSCESAQSLPPALPPGSPTVALSLGAGSRPATPAWCPIQACPLPDTDFSTWLHAWRTLIPPQLRKAPSPSLVQRHHIRLSRMESAGRRSAGLPGNLRIQELLMGRSAESWREGVLGLTRARISSSRPWERQCKCHMETRTRGPARGGRARCHYQGV